MLVVEYKFVFKGEVKAIFDTPSAFSTFLLSEMKKCSLLFMNYTLFFSLSDCSSKKLRNGKIDQMYRFRIFKTNEPHTTQHDMRDGISPRGYIFIMLLAIQFGMQPLFTKTYVNRDADKVMLVLMCEVLKLAIAILLSVCSKKGRESIRRFTLSESLRSAAILAGLYAFQNILIQIGYQNVSGLLFNLLNQTKILFTAIMVYLFTGKTQSRAQMFALFMVLVVGIVLTQPKEDLSEEGKRSAVWSGVVPTLGAAFLSGLGAGWSQRLTRKKNKSAYLFSAEISFYSSVHLVASIVLTSGFETLYPRAINLYERQDWRKR